MQVRLAVPDEAETVWQIRNQAIRHGCKTVYSAAVIAAWTPDAMPESQRTVIARYPFYVAVTPAQEIVATGFLDLDSASVEAIFTLPAWQGKGLATQILQAIKHEAQDRGFSQLMLASTPNACGFYQRQGFTVVRESVYSSALAGTGLACVEMQCQLSASEALCRKSKP